jgi:ABC-type phosphate/phosphonate transport system substrate-binding protein
MVEKGRGVMGCVLRSALLAAAAVAFVQIPALTAADPTVASVNSLRIGVAGSLGRTDPQLMTALMPPFCRMAKSFSGLECKVCDGGDAYRLATRLHRGELDLGIFQGIEFAWIHRKHPELVPLLTVLHGKPYLRACLVVPACRQTITLSDLAASSVAIPQQSLDDVYEFLFNLCREQGLSPVSLLSHVVEPADAEEALDGLLDGTVAATVVEEFSLDCYRGRKPGRFQRLRIVRRSECFPATVIAYRAGGLAEETLRTFRKGMCGAHQGASNRELLTCLRISAFAPVPPNYQQRLEEIAKAYPAPSGASRMMHLRFLIRQTNRLFGQSWSSSGPAH